MLYVIIHNKISTVIYRIYKFGQSLIASTNAEQENVLFSIEIRTKNLECYWVSNGEDSNLKLPAF